jgi:hypothetical protein
MNRIGNLVWAVLIIAVAAFLLAQGVGALPPAAIDIVNRSLPAVLIAIGLFLLLGRRSSVGNIMAVALPVMITAGVVAFAYSRQSTEVREDYTEPISQLIAPEVTNLVIDVDLLLTSIEVTPELTSRTINGEFVGSIESLTTADYTVDGNTGTLRVRETNRNAIPALSNIGRGRFVLRIPTTVTVDQLTVRGRDGLLTVDAFGLDLRNMTINLDAGAVTVTMPNQTGVIGQIRTGNGDVSVSVPTTIPAQITLRGAGAGSPRFSDALYIFSVGNILIPRTGDPQLQLSIEANGVITVQ